MLPCYDAGDVARHLSYEACREAVSAAMADFSAGGRAQPLRSITEVEPNRMFAQMPGLLEGNGGFGAKIISVFPAPASQGGTLHQGLVVLFSAADGSVLCTADAHEITKRRTAAASAVATSHLARKNARVMGVFGTGTQAEAHILALKDVLPLEDILVCGRDQARAEGFGAGMSAAAGIPVRAEPDGRALAQQADVICTVTGAAEPVLLGDWVRPGTHINLVGSSYDGPREVDDALLLKSGFYVDSRRSVEAAGAEYLHARREGLIGPEYIRGEIGDVIGGRVAGRKSAEEITIYKSLGHVVQDLAAAAHVHRQATREGEE
jgi:ornithine cyclodeaminase